MPFMSFSALKRLATKMRSTMHNNRLNDLLSWYVHPEKIVNLVLLR